MAKIKLSFWPAAKRIGKTGGSVFLAGAEARQRDIVLNAAGSSYLLRPIVSARE